MTFEEILREHEKQCGMVSEPVPAYLYEKQQGEFTVDDYFELPEDVRVELIDGVFYHLVAPSTSHQRVVGEIFFQLRSHIHRNKGKCVAWVGPTNVQLDQDDDTIVLPDVFVVCDKDKRQKMVIFGAPDFVMEVLSPSTQSRDRGIKYTKYKAAGVREYWMVDLNKKTVTVCEFGEEEKTTIYGLEDKVPVGIFEGKLQIDFGEIMEEIGK